MTIRAAVQAMLDAHDDGWSVTQYVVCMGLERVVDGRIESIPWHWCPPDQPPWMSRALVDAAANAMDTPADD